VDAVAIFIKEYRVIQSNWGEVMKSNIMIVLGLTTLLGSLFVFQNFTDEFGVETTQTSVSQLSEESIKILETGTGCGIRCFPIRQYNVPRQ
jgi:hypothetical protein